MSTTITNYFQPERGLSVISPDGLQRYTEALDSYTELASTLNVANINTKFAIDAAWESGDIYFCNHTSGNVKRISFDKTELASLELTNPICLSVIQYGSSMSDTITNPSQKARGCWIADAGTDTVIKTDNDLNIIYEVTGISDVVGIASTPDGGCYVVSQDNPFTVGSLRFISSAGVLQDTLDFGSFIPAITNFVDIATDNGGVVWIVANDLLYALTFSNETIAQIFSAIDPFGMNPDLYSSSSSEDFPETMHISAIDIDRNSGIYQYLYVTGGDEEKAFVIKYDNGGTFIDEKLHYGITYPYIIKVVQGTNSTSLYILEDTEKWDEDGYGSSSSSSSSSNSSDSSSSSIDSSSSTSSSSSSSSS